jgi:hypothetical protein
MHPHPEAFTQLFASSDKQVSDLLYQLMGMLSQFASLSQAKVLEPSEIGKLEQKGARIYQLWDGLGTFYPKLHITPKLHLLAAHITQFARQRGWFGLISEQAIEHMHGRFNRIEPRFSNSGFYF